MEKANTTVNEDTLNCAVFVNSFVQAAEVMDRLRREAEPRMKKLGFDFVQNKKYKLSKILRSSEEIRRLFEDAFLYGSFPIEAGLYDNGGKYDQFLSTASKMAIIFLLIMDRCHTDEQEKQLLDLLYSMPERYVSKEELDRMEMR